MIVRYRRYMKVSCMCKKVLSMYTKIFCLFYMAITWMYAYKDVLSALLGDEHGGHAVYVCIHVYFSIHAHTHPRTHKNTRTHILHTHKHVYTNKYIWRCLACVTWRWTRWTRYMRLHTNTFIKNKDTYSHIHTYIYIIKVLCLHYLAMNRLDMLFMFSYEYIYIHTQSHMHTLTHTYTL